MDWFTFSQRFARRMIAAAHEPVTVLVELLIIGVVVYTVLRFVHGTRGSRMVRAVLFLLALSFFVVQFVARQLKLDRIIVLYPYFVFSVFLVFLVAFQSDLRRLMIRLGEISWLGGGASKSKSIDPLVTAVVKLSQAKIGALIAIERTTQLGAIVDTGVTLDAEISTELIETIFWPGCPLHDLGVIVRRDRIVAAGCQFPLVEVGEIDRSLGSRHRAGVGVSAESDALVIVVSEETGSISVALHGALIKDLVGPKLKTLVLEALSSPARAEAEQEPEAPDVAAAESAEEARENDSTIQVA